MNPPDPGPAATGPEPGAGPAPLDPANVRHLVVHCSATPDDAPITAREIHAMHLGFGWHGIGYHRVIARDGTIEGGRPDYWVGAHVYGRNEASLGVCLVGCEAFTDAQLDSLELVLRFWREDYPGATVCGHRDFPGTDKTCPNMDVGAFCRAREIDPGPGVPGRDAPRPGAVPPPA